MEAYTRPIPPDGPGSELRGRLLDAAAACFAERGYSGTSVRDITSRAGCNVSAVNYHFAGKRNLYVAVLGQRLAELSTHRVETIKGLLARERPRLEELIEAFSWAFLEPLRGGDRGRHTTMLIMREMIDQHLPRELIAEELFKPTLGALREGVARACPALAEERVLSCCQSLVSQLIHVIHIHHLRHRGRAGHLSAMPLEEMVAHIVRFSAGGIRACAGEAAQR